MWFSKLQSRFRRSATDKSTKYSEEKSLRDLEAKMAYRFKDFNLLRLALTHPSYNIKNPANPNNQRLEFLGDSILGAVLSAKLYDLYPNEDEGSLSRKRSFFARGTHLVKLGSFLKLEKVIKMSPTEIKHKGNKRSSTLEDGVEALIGAIYLDGGFQAAQNCILSWIGNLEDKLEDKTSTMNPKGKLQELVQSMDEKPRIRYNLIDHSGPDHAKSFIVELRIGQKIISQGKGNSKKQAESSAAAKAIQYLNSGRFKMEQ